VTVLIVGNLRIRHEIKRKSALTFDGGVKLSHPFEVRDHTTGDTHDVVRVRTEVVIPRSRSSPHFVVLQQVRINEYTQLSAVTKRRNASIGLGNLLRGAQTSLDIF
jgi:hypothetical protein